MFLKITTESGISGWGEPLVEGRADTVMAAVKEMEQVLVGRDAGNIEDISWYMILIINKKEQ